MHLALQSNFFIFLGIKLNKTAAPRDWFGKLELVSKDRRCLHGEWINRNTNPEECREWISKMDCHPEYFSHATDSKLSMF